MTKKIYVDVFVSLPLHITEGTYNLQFGKFARFSMFRSRAKIWLFLSNKTFQVHIFENIQIKLVTLHLKIVTRLVFAGRWTEKFYVCVYEYNKVVQCNYSLKSWAMLMYWQQIPWLYSDDAVCWKAA